MLNSLTLTNFKRHRDLSIDFTAGINATRGANEAGKTTMLEAMGYALFGSAALNLPMEEIVTWGEDLKTMQVSLNLTVGDKTYVFSRGKSGAEVVTENGVLVTGQKEVASFAATLLGADSNASSKLMFASQNALRGALEQGPKVLSQMIEDLAGFDAFDTILAAAQDKLTLGNPGVLEERLKGYLSSLEGAAADLPAKPDEEAFQASITALGNQAAEAQGRISELTAARDLAKTKWMDKSSAFLRAKAAADKVATAKSRWDETVKQVEDLRPAARVEIDDQRENLKATIADCEQYDKRETAYRFFMAQPEGERYAGTSTEFQAAVDAANLAVRDATVKIADLKVKITAAQGRRINHDKCDKCGQDVTHLSTVIETNAAVDAELESLKPQLATLEAKLVELTAESQRLAAYRHFADKLQGYIAKLGSFCDIDESTFPVGYRWRGEVPSDAAPDTQFYRRQLINLETQLRERDQAVAKLELAEAQMIKAQSDYVDAKDALAQLEQADAEDVLALDELKVVAENALTQALGAVACADLEIANLTRQHEAAVQLWKVSSARVVDFTNAVAKTRQEITDMGFNNALVKKIRGIRPEIANALWNKVLASVSVMFSQMRGEESWITKESNGFKVNGRSVEGLSGSTLDILGLAIRCALIRTFLPECGLLVLDEPCHGADNQRTEAMLGFIASSGFKQVLLVTHEGISEAFCENLILL